MSARDDAVNRWLALEREAVWFYPFAGARVPGAAAGARAATTAHTLTRDRLLALVDDDTTTVQPSYDVGALDSVESVSTAARRLEQRVQAACVELVLVSQAQDREVAVSGLRRAALAEIDWSGRARAFPGLDD